MAASISDIKVVPKHEQRLVNRINWLYPTLVLSCFFAFFRLDQAPLQEQHEAHIGLTAIDLLETGNWLHLHLAGELDRARVFPPIVPWMVASNFSIFGYSVFSLRLHSAIATLFIFLFLYRLIQLYQPPLFAFGVCLILLSVEAIIGYHVGQTGDVEAVFIALLLGGLYFFLRYLDFMRYKDIYIAAIFWGFAFWVKGIASLILFPSLIVYLLLNNRLRHILRLREVYKALGIMLFFAICWYLLKFSVGPNIKHTFENLDSFPYTASSTANPWFVWHTLQGSFQYWIWVFLLVLLFGCFQLFRQGMPQWEPHKYRLTLLAMCIWLPMGFLLSIWSEAELWDYALAIPFVAILTMMGIWKLYEQYPIPIGSLFVLFWAFTMYAHYAPLSPGQMQSIPPGELSTTIIDKNAPGIAERSILYIVDRPPPHRVWLDLHLSYPNVSLVSWDDVLVSNQPNALIFIRQEARKNAEKYGEKIKILDEDEHYLILEKN